MSAGYELGKNTHATADIAFGRMTQDDAFLPYTINSSLTTQPLPRSSLDGRVDTMTGNLKIASAVTDKLRLNAAFTYDDRDNQTPQAMYDGITTDVMPGLPRTNLPYSSTHSLAKLDAGYALTRGLRIDAGCDYDEYERDLQEVEAHGGRHLLGQGHGTGERSRGHHVEGDACRAHDLRLHRESRDRFARESADAQVQYGGPRP